VFFDGQEFCEFAAKVQPSGKSHGSGCAFSAAITAGLANRMTLLDAIDQAKQLVNMAIQYSDGQGGARPGERSGVRGKEEVVTQVSSPGAP